MEIKLQNKFLETANNFLYGLTLKNKESRARNKLITLIIRKYEEYLEDEREILKEYCEVDKDGNLLTKYNETTQKDDYVTKVDVKISECNARIDELSEEEIIMDATEYKEHIKRIEKALLKIDIDLSGQEAEIYDLILDALEEATSAEKAAVKK